MKNRIIIVPNYKSTLPTSETRVDICTLSMLSNIDWHLTRIPRARFPDASHLFLS